MINLKNVSFAYNHKYILNNVNLNEKDPVIIGLWGRNGSGKTTLMKLLSGLEAPTKGSVEIDGVVPYNNIEAMNHVTFMQEDHPYSDLWDVNHALDYAANFNDKWNQELADHLLEIFQLPRKQKIRQFSKGMKTMLTIVIGLASMSPVTIFDEPSNGLDAHMRKQFYDALLDSYEDKPRVILLSTHHIEEVEPLCEKIAIIDNNTLLSYEETETLKLRGVHLSGPYEKVHKLASQYAILEERKLGKQINVMIDAPFTEELKQEADSYGISIEKAPFQDYLVNLTKKEAKLHAHS